MPTIRRPVRLTAVAAAVAVTAATLLPAAPAAASTHCAAQGVMPHRVALHRTKTVVRIVLRGSAGCHHQRTDNGATATLVRPSGAGDAMRWRHFGSVQSVTMYVNIVRSGTFRLRRGDVQVYNERYRRVPWSWTPTAMVVKRAAHISHVSAAHGVVSGRTKHYTMYGWQSYAHTRVFVQRRAIGSPGWHTIGSASASKQGWVHYATSTSSRYDFRLTVRATAKIWDARSRSVRG